jgi:selenium-binding protein 1
MFDGHIYVVDPGKGTGAAAFDCSTVQPHVDTPVKGGMGQILATPQSGDRLIFSLFMAGQVGMLDTTDRNHLKQVPGAIVSFGANAGPHNIVLTDDDAGWWFPTIFSMKTIREWSTWRATTRCGC